MGKTSLGRWLDSNGYAYYLPGSACKSSITIIRSAYDRYFSEKVEYLETPQSAPPRLKCPSFYINITRTTPLYGLTELMMGIEELKDGFLYDERNHWKSNWIVAPHITVVMNEEPEWIKLTLNRWRAFTIEKKKEAFRSIPIDVYERAEEQQVAAEKKLRLERKESPTI